MPLLTSLSCGAYGDDGDADVASLYPDDFTLAKTASYAMTRRGTLEQASMDDGRDDAHSRGDDRARYRDRGESVVGGWSLDDGTVGRDGAADAAAGKGQRRDRDFDVDPTDLYVAIHNRSWKEVTRLARSKPDQASQWMCRYEDDGNLRWRTLPLHGAILFRAPNDVIEALIRAYPQGASCPDDRGIYPLHLALKAAAPVECVTLLVNEWPDCVDVADETGCVPLVLAKKVQSFDRRKYIRAVADALRSHRSECDFDTNPTLLYQYLQKKMWTRDVDDLLNRDDAATFVCRREDNGKVRWRMLPLMAAIVFGAPDAVTHKIFKTYPEAAGLIDDRKMLPIHAALYHGSSESIVLSLLHAYPQGIETPDSHGCKPMDYALKSKSPFRDTYVEALELGPDFYAATRECDANTDPTALYKSISRSDWDSALRAVKSRPDEARTWVSQKGKDGRIYWRMLPAHACVLFKAPKNVFVDVLRAYPDAASCKDHVGMLPIHHALQHGAAVDIIEELLTAYPHCLVDADREGRTPFTLAESSSSPLKVEYVKALDRGPGYYARKKNLANLERENAGLGGVGGVGGRRDIGEGGGGSGNGRPISAANANAIDDRAGFSFVDPIISASDDDDDDAAGGGANSNKFHKIRSSATVDRMDTTPRFDGNGDDDGSGNFDHRIGIDVRNIGDVADGTIADAPLAPSPPPSPLSSSTPPYDIRISHGEGDIRDHSLIAKSNSTDLTESSYSLFGAVRTRSPRSGQSRSSGSKAKEMEDVDIERMGTVSVNEAATMSTVTTPVRNNARIRPPLASPVRPESGGKSGERGRRRSMEDNDIAEDGDSAKPPRVPSGGERGRSSEPRDKGDKRRSRSSSLGRFFSRSRSRENKHKAAAVETEKFDEQEQEQGMDERGAHADVVIDTSKEGGKLKGLFKLGRNKKDKTKKGPGKDRLADVELPSPKRFGKHEKKKSSMEAIDKVLDTRSSVSGERLPVQSTTTEPHGKQTDGNFILQSLQDLERFSDLEERESSKGSRSSSRGSSTRRKAGRLTGSRNATTTATMTSGRWPESPVPGLDNPLSKESDEHNNNCSMSSPSVLSTTRPTANRAKGAELSPFGAQPSVEESNEDENGGGSRSNPSNRTPPASNLAGRNDGDDIGGGDHDDFDDEYGPMLSSPVGDIMQIATVGTIDELEIHNANTGLTTLSEDDRPSGRPTALGLHSSRGRKKFNNDDELVPIEPPIEVPFEASFGGPIGVSYETPFDVPPMDAPPMDAPPMNESPMDGAPMDVLLFDELLLDVPNEEQNQLDTRMKEVELDLRLEPEIPEIKPETQSVDHDEHRKPPRPRPKSKRGKNARKNVPSVVNIPLSPSEEYETNCPDDDSITLTEVLRPKEERHKDQKGKGTSGGEVISVSSDTITQVRQTMKLLDRHAARHGITRRDVLSGVKEVDDTRASIEMNCPTKTGDDTNGDLTTVPTEANKLETDLSKAPKSFGGQVEGMMDRFGQVFFENKVVTSVVNLLDNAKTSETIKEVNSTTFDEDSHISEA